MTTAKCLWLLNEKLLKPRQRKLSTRIRDTQRQLLSGAHEMTDKSLYFIVWLYFSVPERKQREQSCQTNCGIQWWDAVTQNSAEIKALSRSSTSKEVYCLVSQFLSWKTLLRDWSKLLWAFQDKICFFYIRLHEQDCVIYRLKIFSHCAV